MDLETVTGVDGEPVTITYLTRADWGAGPVTRGEVLTVAPVGWFVHHTVMILPDYDRDGFRHGDLDDVKRYMGELQRARPDLGSEIPYSWVGFRGENDHAVVICEGRGAMRSGAHTGDRDWRLNYTHYAWAVAGNTETEPFTIGEATGFRWLAARFTPKATGPTRGHRDAAATACPGRNAYAALGLLQPPFTPLGTEQGDWFDMATKDDLDEVLRAILGDDAVLSAIASKVADRIDGTARVQGWAPKGRPDLGTITDQLANTEPDGEAKIGTLRRAVDDIHRKVGA